MLSAPQAPAPAAIAESVATSLSQSSDRGASTNPTAPGEHDERHDARFEENEMIDDAAAHGLAGAGRRIASACYRANANRHPALTSFPTRAPDTHRASPPQRADFWFFDRRRADRLMAYGVDCDKMTR